MDLVGLGKKKLIRSVAAEVAKRKAAIACGSELQWGPGGRPGQANEGGGALAEMVWCFVRRKHADWLAD